MNTRKQKPVSITKSQLSHHWQERLNGNNLKEMVVRYKDTDYFKRSDPLMNPETVIYEHIVKESTPEEGHLNWGHITLYPGVVDDQYFCTKGHFHKNPDAEEYLLCMKGSGLVMFLSREGECWCEELEEGSLHKIPADIGRRLINTGDEPLMISQCIPSNAGMDFDAVDDHPFTCHVYDDNGELAIEVDIDETPEMDDEIQEEDIIRFLQS